MDVEDKESQVLTEHPDAAEGIEDLVLSFLQQLVDINNLEFDQKIPTSERRARSKIQLQLANRTAKGPTKTLTYPRKCKIGSMRPFAQLFRIMDLSHEAIISDMPMTKRDIYYNDVQLFKSQRTVDILIDDLAATLDLDRSSLHIRASSKGLICGSGLTILLSTGEKIRPTDTEGALIPAGEDIESFGLDEDIRWVLIVEKEAVFQTLCHLRMSNHHDMPGRGLIITGKGYPDVATRHLVKTLADSLPPCIPIMALVDADPYGLDILSVYNYGSKALKHENKRLAAGGKVVWIGVFASEFSKLDIDRDKLLPISPRDEKKAFAMLQRSNDVLPLQWKRELEHILSNRHKAEIEILSSLSAASNNDDLGDISDMSRNRHRRSAADMSYSDVLEGAMSLECSDCPYYQEKDLSHGGLGMPDFYSSIIKGTHPFFHLSTWYWVPTNSKIVTSGTPTEPMLCTTERNIVNSDPDHSVKMTFQLSTDAVYNGVGGVRSGLFAYLRYKITRLVREYEKQVTSEGVAAI